MSASRCWYSQSPTRGRSGSPTGPLAQYAFTRAVADHAFSNYDGVLKVDGDVGRKSAYDPRSWGAAPRPR